MPTTASFQPTAGLSDSSRSSSGSAASSRGAFILFEGIDRCGKSTQSAQLVEHLKAKGTLVTWDAIVRARLIQMQVDAELLRFPDRTTEVGKMIDAYLGSRQEIDDAAVHLLFSANRWEKQAELLRKLQAGTTLVVDRYAYSGVAFTAAKQLLGLDLDWCKAPDRGLPAPDVVVYLQLSIEQAMARGGFGEERYEKQHFQQEVQKQFAALRDSRWQMIDATQSVEDIQQEVRQIALETVKRCALGRPISTFWD